MVSIIPSGFQGLAYQDRGLSLDMITYLAGSVGWADQVRSNSSPTSEEYDDAPSPLYAVLTDLWGILGGLEAKIAPLERCICIAHYIQLMSMHYRKIVQASAEFRLLRAEATDIMHWYQPRTHAERENLIFHSMNVVNAWKYGTVLDPEGIRLLVSLKLRFAEMRQWDTLVYILQKFPWISPSTAEWKDSLQQSSMMD